MHVTEILLSFQSESERFGMNCLESEFSDGSPDAGQVGSPIAAGQPAARGTGRKRGRPKGSGTGRGRASKGASPSSSPKPVN